jgi:hypothetical protein
MYLQRSAIYKWVNFLNGRQYSYKKTFLLRFLCISCQRGITAFPEQLDWLIDYLLFYVPLKNISLIWRRHHHRWRAAKFWPMLGAQGLWAGRDLYSATPAVKRDLGFSGIIRRTAPFCRLLRHTRGCGGSNLTGPLSVAFYDTQGDVEDLF